MFGDIGPVEIGLILLIILLVFGAGKLPTVGRDLGKAIREFRKASRENPDDVEKKDAKATVQATASTSVKEEKK